MTLHWLIAIQAVGFAEPKKDTVIGIWWGTAIVAEYEDTQDHQRDHWVIERKPDGTYRVQEFRVDHVRKLYFALTENSASGTWKLDGGAITHRLNGKDHLQKDAIRIDGDIIRWDRLTDPEPLRHEVRFTEQRIERFTPKLEQGFRRVSEEAFDRRMEANVVEAGTGHPAARPESKLEGSDKPQPQAEKRSR